MIFICAEETDFWKLCGQPARWDWEPTSTQVTVKGYNWVSLTYGGFNPYLVITRLIHEERLGVCDHEITQIKQFAQISF